MSGCWVRVDGYWRRDGGEVLLGWTYRGVTKLEYNSAWQAGLIGQWGFDADMQSVVVFSRRPISRAY